MAPEAGETVVRAPAPSPFDQAGEDAPLRNRVGVTTTVADALLEAPSARIYRNARGERLLRLHGFDQRQILVELEGVPLRLPVDGRIDLGKLPVGLVDRVRILRGPAPLSQGPTGMGGAVILRAPDAGAAPRLRLSALATSNAGSVTTRASFRTRSAEVLVAADGLTDRGFPLPAGFSPARNEDGGRRENADRKAGALGVLVRLHPNPAHTITLLGLGWLGAFGVPPGTSTLSPRFWRFPDYDVALLGGSHTGRYPGGWQVREQLVAGLFRNVLNGYDDAGYGSRTTDRSFRSRYDDLSIATRLQARLTLRARGALQRTRIRLHGQARYEAHRDRDDQGAGPALDEVSGALTAEASLRFRGGHWLVAQLMSQAAGPGPTAGASQARSWFLGPLLAYGWQRRRLSLAVSLGRRARFPTLRERFAEVFGAQLPNPGLRPESTWHGWASATYRPWPWLRLTAQPFVAYVQDLIDRQPVQGGQQNQNTGSALMAGVECTVELLTRFGLTAHLGYQLLAARWLHRPSSAGIPGAGVDPDALPGRALHQALLEVAYAWAGRLAVATALRVQSPMPAQDPDTGLVSQLTACVRWDARATLKPFHGVGLRVVAENLLDTRCQSAPGYPEPGRRIWLGLVYESR